MKAAIQTNDVALVRTILDSEPEAAWFPIPDCPSAEPPLCYAARTCCSEEIMRMLLDAGADVNVTDIHGSSALVLLGEAASAESAQEPLNHSASPGPWALSFMVFVGDAPLVSQVLPLPEMPESEAKRLRLASLLLAGGADPDLAEALGRRPADVAEGAGHRRLATLYRYYRSMQAFTIIRRALSSSANPGDWSCTGFKRLNTGTSRAIFEMLIPSHILARANAGLDNAEDW